MKPTKSILQKAYKVAGGVTTQFPLAVDGHNPFLWNTMHDNASSNDLVGNFESARLTLWCDALAKKCFQTVGSNTKLDDLLEGITYWYEKGEALMPSQGDHRERVKLELAAGRPVLTAIYGHEVVIDGWRASGGMAAAKAVGAVGEALIPFERWVLGTGKEQELTADKPGEAAGFYQIRVQIEPPK